MPGFRRHLQHSESSLPIFGVVLSLSTTSSVFYQHIKEVLAFHLVPMESHCLSRSLIFRSGTYIRGRQPTFFGSIHGHTRAMLSSAFTGTDITSTPFTVKTRATVIILQTSCRQSESGEDILWITRRFLSWMKVVRRVKDMKWLLINRLRTNQKPYDGTGTLSHRTLHDLILQNRETLNLFILLQRRRRFSREDTRGLHSIYISWRPPCPLSILSASKSLNFSIPGCLQISQYETFKHPLSP
jgi:hypothetical protein